MATTTIRIKKVCEWCGKEFEAQRCSTRFCSKACTDLAYKKQKRQELKKDKYSVNIPMRYYYKGKFRKGWVNVVNPFRGTWVVGTPGSGKTFSIIEPFIRQHSAKGFAMVVYDYKFV